MCARGGAPALAGGVGGRALANVRAAMAQADHRHLYAATERPKPPPTSLSSLHNLQVVPTSNTLPRLTPPTRHASPYIGMPKAAAAKGTSQGRRKVRAPPAVRHCCPARYCPPPLPAAPAAPLSRPGGGCHGVDRSEERSEGAHRHERRGAMLPQIPRGPRHLPLTPLPSTRPIRRASPRRRALHARTLPPRPYRRRRRDRHRPPQTGAARTPPQPMPAVMMAKRSPTPRIMFRASTPRPAGRPCKPLPRMPRPLPPPFTQRGVVLPLCVRCNSQMTRPSAQLPPPHPDAHPIHPLSASPILPTRHAIGVLRR